MKTDKFVVAGVIFGFVVSIIALLFMASCSNSSIESCLLEKEYLMPDFYWHTNTIKYVAYNGILPYQVLGYEDGGYDGSSLNGGEEDLKNVIHGPLYYYLGAGIWRLSTNLGISQVLTLHIFSIILTLMANILFFLLIKKNSGLIGNKKQITIISTLLFIFFPLNLFLSLAIHTHAIFLVFLTLSFYLYSNLLEKRNLKNSLLLGISLGLGLLSSSMMLPLFLAIIIYTLFNYFFRKDNKIKFLFTSIISGGIIGSVTLIRNYILYNDAIWGGIVAPLHERSFFTLIRVLKTFFSGIYGGYSLIAPLIFIISVLIILISIYGLFIWILKEREKRFSNPNVINLVFLTSLITLILSFHTICNIQIMLKDFMCFGDIIHGRYLLPIVPGIAISFSIGLTKIMKKYDYIKYLLILAVCFLYSLDFIYALIN